MTRRKLTPEQEDEVRRRAAAGSKLRALAAEFRVSRGTIGNIVQRYVRGGPSVCPPRRHPPEKRAEAVRLCLSGVKPDEVAKLLGINRTTIYDALREVREAANR